MAEVTVSELAKVVGASVDRLLSQMQEAGLPHNSADASVSDEEKQTLLAYLKGLHGEQSRDPKKITLKRKTVSTLKTGAGRKTVNVEVRKTRTYVKRANEEETAAPAEQEESVVADSVVEPVSPVVDDPEVKRQAAIETRRKAEEEARLEQENQRKAEEERKSAPSTVEPLPPELVDQPVDAPKHVKKHVRDDDAADDSEEAPKKAKKRGAIKDPKRKKEDLLKAVVEEVEEVAGEKKPRLRSGISVPIKIENKHKFKKPTNKIIHVVGLDFADRAQMHATLQHLQDSRATRGQRITEKLSELLAIDYDELWQDVLTKAGGNPQAVGRAHIGQVLFERGEVKTVQKAFDKYLADHKPAYVAIEALSMARGIELIHACGGKAVLAHPTRYHLSATRVRKLIKEFAELGGDACELPADSEPVSTRRMVDRTIAEHQLATSIGSDFHGSNMPWRRLGDVPTLHEEQRGIWQSFDSLSRQ